MSGALLGTVPRSFGWLMSSRGLLATPASYCQPSTCLSPWLIPGCRGTRDQASPTPPVMRGQGHFGLWDQQPQ